MWVVFKVFVEFITILFLFVFVFVFGYEAHGVLAPKPGTESTPCARKGEVLTTGLPGTMLLPPFSTHISASIFWHLHSDLIPCLNIWLQPPAG